MGASPTCIFCGGRTDSEEHIWPQWLLRLKEEWPAEERKLRAVRLNKQGQVDRWESDEPILVVKSVCQECNCGWMSEVEQRAQPILTPLINGNAKSISIYGQEVIAEWVTKTTMLFDSMGSGVKFYDKEDLLPFAERGQFLDNLNFWIGHYSGQYLMLSTIHGSVLDKRPERPHTSYFQTMAIGRLVIQFAAFKPNVTGPIPNIGVEVTDGPWERGAIVELLRFNLPLQWPPLTSFNDTDCRINEFADRFGLRALE